MSHIQRIPTACASRICSGQVITDLSSAVKELVENSLDAGATTVEIRLKDFGATTIEVADNGVGISDEDFPYIALKHHTSKLCQFEDLLRVASYGFRGEALNALCEVSRSFTVCTRSREVALGSRLVYGVDGRFVDCSDSRRG